MTEAKQPVPELKSCPFCDYPSNAAIHHSGAWRVICIACNAEGPNALVEHTAIKAWNTRATQSPEPLSYCMNPDCIDGKVNVGCSTDAPLITTNCPQCNPPRRDWESNRQDIPVVSSPEPPSADADDLLTDDDAELMAHAIKVAREVQEFIWADCYPSLRPYDAEGWRRLFQKRVDCIAEVDLTRHGGLAALRKRLLQQAALSVKALALVNRWAKHGFASVDGSAAALTTAHSKGAEEQREVIIKRLREGRETFVPVNRVLEEIDDVAIRAGGKQ